MNTPLLYVSVYKTVHRKNVSLTRLLVHLHTELSQKIISWNIDTGLCYHGARIRV